MKWQQFGVWILFGWMACFGSSELRADDQEVIQPEALKFFESKIRPVLVEHCYRCHSNDGSAIRGGLFVDSRAGLRGGGESGPAVVPGNLDESLLWTSINHLDFEMPPGRKLPDATIADFRRWILMGAPDPRAGDVSEIRSTISDEDIERGREFWAFQPPVRPDTPAAGQWAHSPIDHHLLFAMRSAGVEPVEDADANTLVRRLHFDLIGLPPAPERVAAFAAAYEDDVEAAIESEVDWLLGQAAFGERWARHWLDVARYAESSSAENELTFPHAWRYRDWVIRAFNEDKPYDAFIRAQVAGDLLPVEDDQEWAENLIATGFLALGPKNLNERNPRQFSADLVDEQIDVTTRAVLGVSVACARCHDHKFDPIPQTDYYALAGIFQSTETFFGGLPSRRMSRASNLLILPDEREVALSPMPVEELRQLREALASKEEEAAELQRELVRLLRQRQTENGPANQQQRLQLQQRRAELEIAKLRGQLNQYDDRGQPLSLCMGVQDADAPVDTPLLVRGEINQPADEIPRGFVRVLGDGPSIPEQHSGRLQLAEWLTAETNPLTARVMVNRVWMHLMGEPLVAETDNFGFSGQPPTHPELLDMLAMDFMESNWSVKSVIRQIVMARGYRLSSRLDEQRGKVDPENTWYWRAHRRRLPAEAIRDAMLATSGELVDQPPSGSRIAEIGTTVLGPGGLVPAPEAGFGPASVRNRPTPIGEFEASYRSIYLPIARGAVPRSLDVFDFADPSILVARREESNTATQALFMLNNPFVIEQAEAFAERLRSQADTPAARVELAFQLAYARRPTAAERRAGIQFLRAATSRKSESARGVSGTVAGQLDGRPGRIAQIPTAAGRRREIMRRLQARRAAASQPAQLDPLSQFCQSLLASAEFRYLR